MECLNLMVDLILAFLRFLHTDFESGCLDLLSFVSFLFFLILKTDIFHLIYPSYGFPISTPPSSSPYALPSFPSLIKKKKKKQVSIG